MTAALKPDLVERYALSPDDGMMYQSPRGAWVHHVEAAAAISALREERDAALAREKGLREALRVAADDLAESVLAIEDWGMYVPEYFREKHGLNEQIKSFSERVEEARAALAAKEAPNAE